MAGKEWRDQEVVEEVPGSVLVSRKKEKKKVGELNIPVFGTLQMCLFSLFWQGIVYEEFAIVLSSFSSLVSFPPLYMANAHVCINKTLQKNPTICMQQ